MLHAHVHVYTHNKRDTDTDHNQNTKVHVNGINNPKCTLYVNDVMKSEYSQCFCHSEKSSVHQITCGQIQILTQYVSRTAGKCLRVCAHC